MDTEKSLNEMSLEELWRLFPIRLVPYDRVWNEWAAEEIDFLDILLSFLNPEISHIGSTAVAGIWAKPIVDILVTTSDMKDWDRTVGIMENNGYILMGRDDRRMSFNKGYTPFGYSERVFHIHFHLTGDDDEIRFRDYLIANPDAAKEYERLKLSLLPRFRNDRDGYTAAKSDFINEILRKASNGIDRQSSLSMVGDLLGRKAGLSDIKKIARGATADREILDFVWRMTASEERRTAVNSLWALTHLDEPASKWLQEVQPELIGNLLTERDVSKKRMYLQLLREQEFDPEEETTVRLLDYCFSKINSECEPYAVRCFSIYVAFRICRDYPELVSELEQHLDLLSLQPLSPGLESGLRQTRRKIARLRKGRAK